MYKIIAKVLANKLKMMLGDIVYESQNSFVKEIQILDSVLIANECFDGRQKSGVPMVLCKLDVQKTYDHVNWDFLIYKLDCCGFLEKWRRWVSFCISTVKFSIVIVMDVFSKRLDKAVKGDLMSGVRVGPMGNSFQVTHLLFVDNTLVLCDAGLGQILFLQLVMFWLKLFMG